jgi:hypothetical protein
MAKQSASAIAVVALAVSIFALMSNITNTSINLVKYGDSQRQDLTPRCRVKFDSPLRIVNSRFPIGGFNLLSDTPDGTPATWVDFAQYQRSLVVPIECILTNDSERPVSVSGFRPSYRFGTAEPNRAALLGFLPMDGFSAEYNAPAFVPHLIKAGDEALYLLNVRWPLTNRAYATFRNTCPEGLRSGSELGVLAACLEAHKLTLADDPGWTVYRGFEGVEIVVSGGRSRDVLGVSGPYHLTEHDFI